MQKDRDDELAREIRTHLELEAEEHLADGMSPDQARYAARRAFGNVIRTQEDMRAAWTHRWLDEARQNVRYVLRALVRSPGFACVAIITLALGVTANATIFSLADALLLRGEPEVSDPDRLVDIGRTVEGLPGFGRFSDPDYVDYRSRNAVFDDLAAYQDEPEPFGFAVGGGATRVFGSVVTGNYFSVLGVRMTLGRAFTVQEGTPGNPQPVVVISDRLWRQQFGRAGDVIGRTVRLNARPFTIVGVAAPGFDGHRFGASDLWVPLATHRDTGSAAELFDRRNAVWQLATARLKPGVTLDQAQAEMTRIAQDLQREHYPGSPDRLGLEVMPPRRLPPALQTAATAFVSILFVFVGLILLVACTNVSGMLLARGISRTREVALRLALGATRGRITRLLLTDGVVLASAAAGAGIAGAWVAINALQQLVPVLPLPVAIDFRLDWRVIAFSVTVSGIAAVLAGLAPALQASRHVAATPLIAAATSRAPGRRRLQHAGLIVQIAASLLLVVCALVLARSLKNAGAIDPGFTIDNVDMVSIDLTLGGYAGSARVDLVEGVVTRAAQLPMVEEAGTSRTTPLIGFGESPGPVWLPGAPRDRQNAVQSDWNVISPGYFDTVRTRLTRGRVFTNQDRDGAPDVVIINETLARRLWPGRDPIGQTLVLPVQDSRDRTLRVVGVARDGKYRTLSEAPQPFIYAPYAQHPQDEVKLLLRTNGQSSLAAVRTLIRQMNPDLPLVAETTLEDATALGLIPHRLASWIASALSVVGLLLSSLGIYGVIAYAVTHRTREIGIRVALGALRASVVGLVVRQAISLTVLGAAIGLLAASLVTQLLENLLFGVQPIDPVSFAGASLLLALVALAASVIPARRAASINPSEALRTE